MCSRCSTTCSSALSEYLPCFRNRRARKGSARNGRVRVNPQSAAVFSLCDLCVFLANVAVELGNDTRRLIRNGATFHVSPLCAVPGGSVHRVLPHDEEDVAVDSLGTSGFS
jgi:hypothetical protein